MTDLISPESVMFIDKFGFPIFIATVLLGIFILILKKDVARQDRVEVRFDNLVNRLFESVTILVNKNEILVKDTNKELKNIAIELRAVSVKIDVYTKMRNGTEIKYIRKEQYKNENPYRNLVEDRNLVENRNGDD
jgi:hypothetical protein